MHCRDIIAEQKVCKKIRTPVTRT